MSTFDYHGSSHDPQSQRFSYAAAEDLFAGKGKMPPPKKQYPESPFKKLKNLQEPFNKISQVLLKPNQKIHQLLSVTMKSIDEFSRFPLTATKIKDKPYPDEAASIHQSVPGRPHNDSLNPGNKPFGHKPAFGHKEMSDFTLKGSSQKQKLESFKKKQAEAKTRELSPVEKVVEKYKTQILQIKKPFSSEKKKQGSQKLKAEERLQELQKKAAQKPTSVLGKNIKSKLEQWSEGKQIKYKPLAKLFTKGSASNSLEIFLKKGQVKQNSQPLLDNMPPGTSSKIKSSVKELQKKKASSESMGIGNGALKQKDVFEEKRRSLIQSQTSAAVQAFKENNGSPSKVEQIFASYSKKVQEIQTDSSKESSDVKDILGRIQELLKSLDQKIGALGEIPSLQGTPAAQAGVNWLNENDLAGSLANVIRRQALRKGINLQ